MTKKELLEQIFMIRPVKDEDTYVITIGDQLASLNKFEKREDAEEYLEEPHWDTMLCLLSNIVKQEKEK